MYSKVNPYRGKNIPLFQAWLHHLSLGKGHERIAKDLFYLATLARRKEKVWDLCLKISEKYYVDKK